MVEVIIEESKYGGILSFREHFRDATGMLDKVQKPRERRG